MTSRNIVFVIIPLLLLAAVTPGISAQISPEYDILIRGGKVLDGTGNPWFYADIAIKDGVIAEIGVVSDRVSAQRVINAEGLTVTPGFIDIHSHAFDRLRPDSAPLLDEKKRRAAPNLVSQGVTTLATNQDGRGGWTIAAQKRKLEQGGVGPNVLLLVGHGVVRALAMGNDYRRAATGEEIETMRSLVRQGMDEGAYGISAGLEYVPGRWSTTDEIVALVGEIVPYGGVFIEHERSSGEDPMWYFPSRDLPGPPNMFESVAETIEIAERTGATSVVSHMKARGARLWGAGQATVNLIQNARERGVTVWADSYPYNSTGSDGNTSLIPPWIQGDNYNYKKSLQKVLEDPDETAGLRQDIAHEINRRGGAANLIIMDHPDESNVRKSLARLSDERGLSEVDMAIALALEGFPDKRGGARIRGFSLSETDVEHFASQQWTATISDAGIALPGDGPVHARFYGTFPRKIREYAMTRKVHSVEDAVRSMTSLPAQILGFKDRGIIREGSVADIAVLDMNSLRDTATFFEPHHYAEGVEFVLVNGEFVVDSGELTWNLPGRILSPVNN
jgi:N-acyl-D-amino-acid deacylase